MAFNTKFSLPSFLKQVKKLTDSQKDSIKRAGFGNLLLIPDNALRRSQLFHLMEKWSSEKQTFIFPPGELTITLLDVSLILGLRVIGQPVVLQEGVPLTSLEKEFGASVLNRMIGVELLKERLESIGERDDESFIRVFLLYCFGTLLFPSVNGKVDSRYLYLLQDVDSVSSFAWGAAVLEYLCNCLSQRKSKKTSSIGGCLILLQIWCYEHIIIGRPKLLDHPSTFPRVCRWESSARHYSMSSRFSINFEELEHTQILWKLEPTSEELEIDIIREIPQEWFLRTGPGTIEQPIEVESNRAIRTVRVHTEQEEEEEEPMSQEKSTIFVPSDEWFLRTGPGTIEQPIEVERNRAIQKVRVHTEQEEEEEEEPMKQEESTIFVLSGDEESKEVEDLKKEILELKEIIEERKEQEAKERVEYEDEIKGLRKRVQYEEELRKRVQDENEELRKRVQKEVELRMRVQNENLETMKRVEDEQNLRKMIQYEEELRKGVEDENEELRKRVQYEKEELLKRVQDEEELRKRVQYENEELLKRVQDEEELRKRVQYENEELRKRVQYENEQLKRVQDEEELRKRVQYENEELLKRVQDEEELKKRVQYENEELRKRVQYKNEELLKRVEDEQNLRKKVENENEELGKRVERKEELRKRVERENENLCKENMLMEEAISDLGRLLLRDSVEL